MEIQKWREILSPYELAVDELRIKFNYIIKQNKAAGRYSPIEQVICRVKTVSSILDKAKRKGIDLENVEEKITDIAGVRLICQFVEDIDKVVNIIRDRPDMEVMEENDYVHHSKPSGYQSYHMVVRYEVTTIHGPKLVPVEIQIRTMAMNFWATIEHSLKYKYSGNVPEHIGERLLAAAQAVINLDKEMSMIREDIVMAQDLFFNKARIVSEIKNNIQNLYKFENRDAMLNIQNEFFDLYQNGTLEELEEFNRQLDLVAARQGVQEL
ncbi:GTP pyrophosphokinase family protein [Cuneatibacter sp. NSJ-177]|uniref:GTP pyrophosphokinase n=1 Tax=Cuneatibacter sp. NSJ-177 TaxID=2931401 RepID=UPI001FD5D806|nr:GTP pyrophosphokinase family protein [Cuneatibacter sp. NSJ-177]MCJ7834484.1 GTP pyrophosphokinase family protein [Cuneatibacter sp. NSJ-177]